jgi:intracellular sulfur oxidation DsrE/DsrF family protein
MTPSPTLVRRSFLGRLSAVAAAVGASVAIPAVVEAAPARAPGHPADAWLDDLKGMHKVIYDCTTAAGAPNGWFYARNFLTANTAEPYKMKDADLSVIVSVRHFATGFAFNDAMWAKYRLGEMLDVKDGDKGPATRNPQTTAANDLAKRGVVVAACGLATAFFAGQIATKMGLKAADVEADLRANLLTPSARIVAAGVVVVNRAQERQFSYTYVG